LVPYVSLNVVGLAARSALHSWDAFLAASSFSASSSAAFLPTQSAKPSYSSLNASLVAFDFPRSVTQSALAASRSDLSGLAIALVGMRSTRASPAPASMVFMPAETPGLRRGSEVMHEPSPADDVLMGDATGIHNPGSG
jgi:hypothetical protein